MNDQRSLKDQLDDLEKLAAKHGLYDAQDWVKARRDRENAQPKKGWGRRPGSTGL